MQHGHSQRCGSRQRAAMQAGTPPHVLSSHCHAKPKCPHLLILKAAVLAQHVGQEVHEPTVLLQRWQCEGGKARHVQRVSGAGEQAGMAARGARVARGLLQVQRTLADASVCGRDAACTALPRSPVTNRRQSAAPGGT